MAKKGFHAFKIAWNGESEAREETGQIGEPEAIRQGSISSPNLP